MNPIINKVQQQIVIRIELELIKSTFEVTEKSILKMKMNHRGKKEYAYVIYF